jgi:hypothetical protein
VSDLVILLAFGLVGVVVLRTIRPADPVTARERGLRWLTAAALTLALASTWTAASLFSPMLAFSAIAVGLLAMFACALRRPDPLAAGPPDRFDWPPAPRALVALAALACAVAAFVVASRLSHMPDGEADAFAVWSLRARLFLRSPGDPSVFSIGANADYPLLLPGLVALGWKIAGEGAGWVSGAIAALFLALAFSGIVAAVKPRRGATAAILSALALLAMPHVLHRAPWRYADVPLAAFLVLAIGWLASAYERPARARSALALAGLCASMAAWTKNEGSIHVVALALVLALRPPKSLTRRRAVACALAGATPFLAVLLAFKLGFAPNSEYGRALAPATLLGRLTDGSRHLAVARHVFDELLRGSHWNFLLPAAALTVGFFPCRDMGDIPAGRVVGLAALAYAAIYVVTPYPLAWQLDTSLDRLMLQLCPALLVALALRVAPPPPPLR